MRPPLSPRTDAELRTSCAYVLQHFKPSHELIPVKALSTTANKPQLDYAAIKDLTHWPPEAGPLLSQTISHGQPDVPRESARDKSRSKSEAAPSSSRHPSAILRADQLMGPARSGSHSRDLDIPQLALATPLKIDLMDRSRATRRQDSVDTTGSTPQTDSTEDPWFDRASTAVTSAMVSKRTSSQAPHPAFDCGSVPKIDQYDASWMRLELEKHRKMQEDRSHSEKLEHDRDLAYPASTLVTTNLSRKPVPTSDTTSRQQSDTLSHRRSQDVRPAAPRQDSQDVRPAAPRQDSQDVRPSARRQHSHDVRPSARRQDSNDVRRADARPVPETDRQPRAASRAASRARSLSRGVKEYFRPPPQSSTAAIPPSPAPHRTRSFSRYVRDHVRSATTASSRRPSADYHRTAGRAQSVDSTGSAASAAPSLFSNSWRRMSRIYGNGSNVDVTQPESANATLRGRDRTRSLDPSNAKSKTNLNRDLPPLPSLDSWKAATSQNLKSEPIINGRDSVVSSGPADHMSSMQTSMPSTVRSSNRVLAPPQTYTPTSARDSVTNLAISSEGLTNKIEARALKITTRDRQSSKESRPPVSYRDSTPTANPSKTRPVINTKAPQINYSRPGGQFNSVGAALTTDTSPDDPAPTHSPTHIDVIGSFEKFSMDDYSRTYEDQFQHFAEISPTCPMPPSFAVHTMEKSKRKWWQGKEKKPETWMDQVIRSGSNNGMIFTDEVAAAPIVRY